ncbi:MAG: secretin N-terminal domain-containing protein, partial [bacterium]
NEGAKALLEKIKSQSPNTTGGLIFSSRAPISLHFNRTDLRAAFDFIGRSFGINIIFDDGLKAQEVTLAAENVTFDQALDLILHTTQTFYKPVGPNTILVADDTPEKHAQYDDLLIENIQLNAVKASDMANLLKSIIDLKHMVVNDSLNTLTIRDTADKLKLAEEIIEANDRPPAEVLLDVDILEVNRTKAEQLGMDYGQAFQLSFPQMTVAGISHTDFANSLGSGSFILPTLTLNYLKQDVDAKTLAHPQIRVLDSKEAKIHIGDRVPLPSAVIQQTTGQVQTTYNYSDIGVLLDILPTINLDRTVRVKLSLEVSSLGPNLGTTSNPAYEIGTRDADTTMLLHDGESAILGGLIQDNDSKTNNHIPIIGDFPLLGDLLAGNVNNSDSRTDILLTITPHIVRDWTFPHKELREVYSGTQDHLSSKPLFSLFKAGATGAPAPKIDMGDSVGETALTSTAPVSTGTPTLPFQGANLAGPAPNGGIIFSFDKPEYNASLGQLVELKLYGENLGKLKNLPLAVAFNAGFLKFVSAEAGSPAVEKVETDSDSKHGLVRMNLTLKSDHPLSGKAELIDLKLSGYTPGISYLIFLNPTFKDGDGNDVRAQAHASRIVVK